MQVFKKIETSFSEYKRDFSNLLDIAITHFNMPFAAIDVFDAGKKTRIASTNFSYSEIDTSTPHYSDLSIYKKPIQVTDILRDDAIVNDLYFEERIGMRFYASAPMYATNNKLIGVFVVMDNKPNQFDQKQLDFLQSLAKQATLILQLKRSKEINDALKSKMEQITFKIAHDIRNPLGALKNVIELQQSGILAAKEANEMLPMLVVEANRIIELTHIIANWGALLIQCSDEQKKPLYLKYVVDEECKKSTEIFSEKKNTIINAIDETMLLNANQELLKFILQQLLSNANKFTRNGTIIITATKTEDKYFIKIADNGVGISPAQLEKINAAKEFVNTKGTNKESGSGMALFLIRELLNESGKKLAIRSDVGKGTEVLVEI